MAVAPDGDLWVGTREELIRIPSTELDQFTLSALVAYHPGPGKASEIICLRFSRSGVLWIGTTDGLFRYDGSRRFLPVGPRVPTSRIEEAPDGNLLVMTTEGLMELTGSEVVSHPGLADRLGLGDHGIFHVLRDRHGSTWYCTGKGVARETRGRIEKLAWTGQPAYRAYEDPLGTVWIAKEEGLFRATSAGLELVAAGMKVRAIYSDRDGNLWVGTNGDGLHRFKDRGARTFTTADGLRNDMIMTVIAAHDGAVWTGANCGGLSRFDGTKFRTYGEKDGLLNECVWALAEDSSRGLWIGTFGGGAFRFHDGKFTQYSKSQGMADDVVTTIVAARNGDVWFGTHAGLTRLRNGQLRTFTTADGLSGDAITKLFEDRAGVLWIGTRKGLDRLAGERIENFPSLPAIVVLPFGEDRDGGLFVEAETDNGHVATRRIDKSRVDTFAELPAYDMVETDQGESWFAGIPLRRLPPGAFSRSRQRDEPLDYEAFSTADGLADRPIRTAGARRVAWTPDGKVWVATRKAWPCSIFAACRSRTQSLRSI